VSILPFPGIDKTSSEFRTELEAMASRLGMDANAIAGVMSLESGFNPAIQNPLSSATGLIQFMPKTAVGLGTTVEALKQMSDVEQLVFVEKYYRQFAGKINTRGDYYIAVFMPGFVNAHDTDMIALKGSKVYDQNAVLDGDKDGRLTVGDVRKKLLDRIRLAEGLPPLGEPLPSSGVSSKGAGIAWALTLGLAGFIFVGTLRKPKRAA
jgi:hypothetical protein